jgi:hypothetical protein
MPIPSDGAAESRKDREATMRRRLSFGSAVVLVLACVAVGAVWAGALKEVQPRGLSPSGAYCATGPIFEQVRPVEPSVDGEDTVAAKASQEESLKGRLLADVQFSYESQPPTSWIFTTQPDFAPSFVYMAEQFRPRRFNSWVRVEFNVLAAVTPPSGKAAGLAYALYIKEDGGDRTIEFPGEMTCGGDDTCGYLDQTFNAPWLVFTSKDDVWSSVGRSDFFRARGRRDVEIQVHLFPIHEGPIAGEIELNNGTLIITAGR